MTDRPLTLARLGALPPSREPRSGVAYLTLEDVVARYGGAYSAWTLREKARRGDLPHLKHPGAKVILFREDWLDAWDDGCELERRTIRQRGLSAGRIVKPRESTRRVPAVPRARGSSGVTSDEQSDQELICMPAAGYS